jgi:hypothetical protein
MTNRMFAMALVAALLSPSSASPQPTDAEARLAAGIRELEEGDLEAAVVTLDGAVQRLKGDPARRKDLARAHLHLSVARLGLGQADSARGEMREALAADPQLVLNPKQFAPRVLQLFEEVRKEAAPAAPSPTTLPTPVPAPVPAPVSTPAPAKKGGGGKIILLVGGAAATAGAVAVAAGGGGDGGGGGGTTPTPNPGGTVSLTLNVSPDSVAPCGSGIAIHLVATNTTGSAVTINSGSYEQRVVSGPCDLMPSAARSTTEPAQASDFSTRTIPPSSSPVEIMNYGRSGSCGSPTSSCIGSPAQCRVQMDVVLNTSAGTFRGSDSYDTSFPRNVSGAECGLVCPRTPSGYESVRCP